MIGNNELIVVKYGSTCVSNEHGIDSERIDNYAAQLAELSEKHQILVVSSGSIAVGRTMWDAYSHDDRPEPDLKTLASLGSAPAVVAWQGALGAYGLTAGQIQVTHHEIADREEGSMLQETIRNNLDAGVISIVNENDALSDVEIAHMKYGGDNDGLAAHIATVIGASRLCLVTETDGVVDNHGQNIPLVYSDMTRYVLDLVWPEPGQSGRGGMVAKVQAATTFAAFGKRAHIAHYDSPLADVLNEKVGTTFSPHTEPA